MAQAAALLGSDAWTPPQGQLHSQRAVAREQQTERRMGKLREALAQTGVFRDGAIPDHTPE
eukprot:gene11094-4081_t